LAPPYNAAHDALIRKYDRDCSHKKVVGCTRPVPAIDKEGNLCYIVLSVEERIDPNGAVHLLPALFYFFSRYIFFLATI
jgi:hypothetical protein